MDELKARIRKEGTVIGNDILKVDHFLNHQIDPLLMRRIGRMIAVHFGDRHISKVLTLESSGIAPALMTGLELRVPVIFARKKKPLTLNEGGLVTEVVSYTKKQKNPVMIEKGILRSGESILIVDDFLARGEAALGLIRLTEMAGATVAGIGIVIEKSFQEGRRRLEETGHSVFSLARIAALDNGQIKFSE